jgi:outer membrane protein assembly factor BamB
MEISNKYVRMLFIALAAFLLLFSISALPIGASANLAGPTIALGPVEQAMGPAHPLYKYLTHVPETQYEWPMYEYDAQKSRSTASPGPTTDHLLWVGRYGRVYESLEQGGAVFNGKLFVQVGKSIYPKLSYAVDQNTGDIVWVYPYRPGDMVKLDDTHMLFGSHCVDIETGTQLWKMPRSVTSRTWGYIPELKIGYCGGPSVGYAGTVIAYDFSDLSKPPVEKWVSEPFESRNSGGPYGDGKIYMCGLDWTMHAIDIMTGETVWSTNLKGLNSRYHAGVYVEYAGVKRVILQGHSGLWGYDPENGELLWHSGIQDTGRMACGFGKVMAIQTRVYLWCWDIVDGHSVWKYLPVREVPHPCGPSGVGGPPDYSGVEHGCNHTSHHISYYCPTIASNGYSYTTSFQKTTYCSIAPPNFPGVLYEGKRYWANPFDVPAIYHPGTNEFVCNNVHTGEVVWRANRENSPFAQNVGTEANPVYIGPDMGQPIVADGKVYGIEEAYSCHTDIGDSRPEVRPGVTADAGEWAKPYITNEVWYKNAVYCYGPGPTEMKVSTDKIQSKSGETVTISGSVVDLSPVDPGIPATKLPVNLSYRRADGTEGAIATMKTDKNGKFSYGWKPASGVYKIVASSPGSASYEAPADATTVVAVEGSVSFSLFETATAVLAVAVIALTVMPNRKPKHEEDQP